MQEFEKLGVFYLGRERDLEAGTTKPDLVLYDAKHLCTHAVVVGMTGSGKTGLCIDLLEEAAIDGIPVIAIDPKGDIANLALGFPELRPEDFLPWVDPQEAQRKGLTPEAFAQKQAEAWREGLLGWGIDGRRIARLRETVDIAVYTPGSNAGLPLSILKSFDAPPAEVLADAEQLRERIATTVTGLLGLVGIDGDPMQSREHILLSSIVDRGFREGRNLDLATLIGAVQTPPFDKVGVLDLESFYPAKERFALVMALNNLVASPGFSAWAEGEPLDVARLLCTREGKPRVSILSIAHLDDAQRMFFVTLLLNQVLAWTRAQTGTASLRAILYMDEIFGYFPPVANPPSKRPLLTLLKQARAFGLGVVLATQNPVDLDYKGLANTGTWMIGRLQTERDKARVLEGLEGAASMQGGEFDRARMEQLLAGLGNRVFLMHDVHTPGGPVVFETRWAMSYLRGPVTRSEIKRITEMRRLADADTPAAAVPLTTASVAAPPETNPAFAAVAPANPVFAPSMTGVAAAGIGAASGASGAAVSAPQPAAATGAGASGTAPAFDRMRPALAPEVPQCFLPLRRPLPPGSTLLYRPMLLGLARVTMSDTPSAVDVRENLAYLTPITDEAVPVHWENAHPIVVASPELAKQPYAEASYHPLHPAAGQAKKYAAWGKELASYVFATRRIVLMKSPSTKLVSRPGESEHEFRLRLGQASRERRDREVEKLRQKFAPKVAKLDERIRRAHANVAREQAQASEAQVATAFSFGSAVLGALSGGRTVSQANVGRVATAARRAQRTGRERADIASAQETVTLLLAQRQELEDEFRGEVAALDAHSGSQEVLEPVTIKPKKAGIEVVLVTLAFAPYARGHAPQAEPLWA